MRYWPKRRSIKKLVYHFNKPPLIWNSSGLKSLASLLTYASLDLDYSVHNMHRNRILWELLLICELETATRKHEFYWYQRWYHTLVPLSVEPLGETEFSATKNPGLLETELLVCELETPRNRILRHIRLLLETEFSCSDLKLLETELVCELGKDLLRWT